MTFGYDGEMRQITLPDPGDMSDYPRILVNGEGIHAGTAFTAPFPDGWHDITLEVDRHSIKVAVATRKCSSHHTTRKCYFYIIFHKRI